MAAKTKTEKPLKLDQKTFLKLMAKREALDKLIRKNQAKLKRVDANLAKFADWLKNLTAEK